MVTPLFRNDTETRQPLTKVATFTYTFNADVMAAVFTVAGNMQEIHKISFSVDLNDLYVRFDGDATVSPGAGIAHTSMLVPAGTGFSEENIFIGTNITAINATATQDGRIRGVCWGR